MTNWIKIASAVIIEDNRKDYDRDQVRTTLTVSHGTCLEFSTRKTNSDVLKLEIKQEINASFLWWTWPRYFILRRYYSPIKDILALKSIALDGERLRQHRSDNVEDAISRLCHEIEFEDGDEVPADCAGNVGEPK